jgi:hypothetical protein
MRPAAVCFAIFTLGASGALAQGVPAMPGSRPLSTLPQAPVGHRQPTPSDLPPDVRKEEQSPGATTLPSSAPTQPSSAIPAARSSVPQQRQTARTRGGGPPTLRVEPSCEAAGRGAVVLGRNKEACLADETVSQDTLKQNWSKYPAGDKTTCIGMETTGGPASYVELLSCLEVLRDARSIQSTDPLESDIEPVGMRPEGVTRAPPVHSRRADRGRRRAL